MSQGLCTSCGYTGETKTVSKGSIDTEIILWFCFLIPGVIYSIWRYRSQHEVCSVCDQATIISAHSPEAQKIIHERENREKEVVAPVPDFRPPSKVAIGTGRVVGRLVGRFFK
ncbi:hypothetical protein [Candidatus Nitrotoga sp. M5]|uniref:hypothetical protein n=1 Tax=Candidatus Nitrotoga sp. M5 TaxID=2890409 RepID=UPI001EF2ED2E|nr:hypothetical protein [Candidatus Nitrotoga sp. M5]CAH1385194.1 conserved hypothetical protein [Candidatus Nitrotoga sp. M5]